MSNLDENEVNKRKDAYIAQTIKRIFACYFCGFVWLSPIDNPKGCQFCKNPVGNKPKYKLSKIRTRHHKQELVLSESA